MKAIAILLVVLGFLSRNTQAQITQQDRGQPDSISINTPDPALLKNKKPNSSLRIPVDPRQFLLMNADMTVQHLPFFCRQEYKFERISGIPLRMRLGSVQQTDWLEQKVRTAAPW